MERVSVIVPVYNAEKYLRQCLDSVLCQTLKALEIVCVDDGSTDSSPTILSEYAARDSRVRVLSEPHNVGTFAARKHGVARATGEWICFVDPDDAIKADFVERLLAAAEAKKCDIVQCGVDLLEMRERTKEQRSLSERYFNPHAPDYKGELLTAAYLDRRIGWNLIFRLFRGDLARRAFAAMPDLLAINETDALAFYYIAREARTFHRIPDRLYVYRYGDGISTRTHYTPDDYARTLGKFDVLAAMPFKEEPAYRAMADRMLDNSFKSAVARLDTTDRGAGWRRLEAKVGPERLLAYLADRFAETARPLVESLSGTDFFTPAPARTIRRIGIHYFRINRGGVQRVMLHVSEQLLALGYEVVLLIEEPPDEMAYPIPDGVRLVSVPRSLGGRAAKPVERVRAMAEILRRERIDLFYTHAYASPQLIWDELLCNRVLHIPIVVHYHAAFTAPLHYRVAPEAFELQDKLLGFADRVIALGELDAAYFRSRGCAARALPNPIPTACERVLDEPLPAKDPKLVLWCGRDSWEKHPEDARRILARVRKLVPGVKLEMLTGQATDPYASFRRASLFLNTSETEGFSMTSLEALAHGVPIVSYALGNLDLYRDNPAVRQVPQGDLAAAAAAIAELLGDDRLEALRPVARASLDWLRRYDFTDFWRTFLAGLAAGERPRRGEAPEAGLAVRIREELAIGEGFRARVRSARRARTFRSRLSALAALMRKVPSFLRENGWRYTFRRVAEKLFGRRRCG